MRRLKNYSILLLTIAVLVLPSTSSSQLQSEQTAGARNDEYEVLSALINELYLDDKVKSIVITNPTCCDTARMDLQTDLHVQQLRPVSNEALEDYVARNRQSITLEKEFKLKTNYQIVPYAEIQKLFSDIDLDNAWKTFYSKYPASGGYLRLSRVGFNKARDQAVVSTAWMAHPLRGEGHYVLLTRQDGSWKVSKKVATWMA